MFKRAVYLSVWALFLAALVSATGFSQRVVISEVAWAGTQASPTDEWIELYNASDQPVDLTGWTLIFGEVEVALGHAADPLLPAGGFFLLERTDDDAVVGVPADLIYTGSLGNAGGIVRLLDPTGDEVDTANGGQEEGWASGTTGTSEPPFATMERVDPSGPDTPSNWRTNDGIHRVSRDAKDNPINGTPRDKNSATLVWETFPVVHLVSSVEEGTPVSGVFVLSWTAHDPDGPTTQLHATVLLSADGGETWEPLIEGLIGTSYAWDAGSIPAGETYRLRVTVTDLEGNTGMATTPVFEVLESS